MRLQDDLAQKTGNRWVFLAVTCLALVLSMSAWFSATAVIPELILAWGLSPVAAAWLTNGVQAGFVVGALGASLLGLPDRWPLRSMMAGSAALACVANLALLAEPGAGLAVAARFVTGVALAGVYPPAIKLMATWFLHGRGLAMGCMIGALTLGSALPHLVRGWGAAPPDWRMVVVASSAACAIAALIFILTSREGPHGFARAPVNLREIRGILRNRPVMLANLGYFGHMWELYAMWGWFLAYAAAAHAAGQDAFAGNASLLTFAVIAAGAPGCILGGLISDRIGRCRTTALMMAVSGAAALGIGLAFEAPAPVFLIIALIWGLTVVADSAQFSTAVTELADGRSVGSALAFQMGTGFALTIFAIWLMPVLAGWLGGWRWVFVALAPGPFLGVWAMLRLRRLPQAAAMAGGLR